MSLFPASPAIRVFAPRAMTPGQSYTVGVELTAKERVSVEWVDASLRHRVGWSVGSGKSRRARELVPLALAARVFEGSALPAGPSRFRATFPLPAGATGSYDGGIAYSRWELHVRASIPWWPDKQATFVLDVSGPDASETPLRAAPRIYKSTRDGDPANAPRLEVSLASDVLSLGGVVSGSLAVFHLEQGKRYQAEISLCENLMLLVRPGRGNAVRGAAFAIDGVVASDGASTPFRFKVPDLAPAFSCDAFELGYSLEVRVETGVFRKLALSVPMTVVRHAELAKQSYAQSVPLVGAKRLDEACRDAAAQRGWAYDDGVMTRELAGPDGTTSAEAHREERARAGSMLVLKMSYPSLGIGLDVTPCSKLAGIFGGDVQVGAPAFDSVHTVRARDPVQARALLAPLAQKLPVTATVRLDDVDLYFEQPDAELSTTAIDAFLALAERLVAALAAGRAAIPAPSAMDARADELRALAAERGARLSLGNLGLELMLGHSPARIALGFDEDGLPTCHQIAVSPTPPPPDGTSFRLVARDDAATHPDLAPEARALLARLPTGTRDIVIDTTELRAELPLTPGSPPSARHREALSVADALARLSPLLTPHRGPFR